MHDIPKRELRVNITYQLTNHKPGMIQGYSIALWASLWALWQQRDECRSGNSQEVQVMFFAHRKTFGRNCERWKLALPTKTRSWHQLAQCPCPLVPWPCLWRRLGSIEICGSKIDLKCLWTRWDRWDWDTFETLESFGYLQCQRLLLGNDTDFVSACAVRCSHLLQ